MPLTQHINGYYFGRWQADGVIRMTQVSPRIRTSAVVQAPDYLNNYNRSCNLTPLNDRPDLEQCLRCLQRTYNYHRNFNKRSRRHVHTFSLVACRVLEIDPSTKHIMNIYITGLEQKSGTSISSFILKVLCEGDRRDILMYGDML